MLLATVLSGCGEQRLPLGSDKDPPIDVPDCASPGPTTVFELPTLERPAYFTTTGGVVRLTVSDLPGGLLADLETTAVYLGDGATAPQKDPDHLSRPGDAAHRVVIGLEAPGAVELGPGRYWLVSARGGRIWTSGCDGTIVSDVALPPPRAPGAEFGVTPGVTPSDTSTPATPGTSPGTG